MFLIVAMALLGSCQDVRDDFQSVTIGSCYDVLDVCYVIKAVGSTVWLLGHYYEVVRML